MRALHPTLNWSYHQEESVLEPWDDLCKVDLECWLNEAHLCQGVFRKVYLSGSSLL